MDMATSGCCYFASYAGMVRVLVTDGMVPHGRISTAFGMYLSG